jgi:copper chaperone NosL
MSAGDGRSRIGILAGCLVLGALALAPAAGARASERVCDYCKMILTEPAFGGRLRTTAGKELVFDATECMAAFLLTPKIRSDQIRSLWSVDHDRAPRLTDARRAYYLLSERRPSPMGVNLSSYSTRAGADFARRKLGGRVLRWEQVLEHVRRTWWRDTR